MVKLRDAQYCNLKLFLMALVIYGHLIEPGIWQSEVLMVQYKGIYLVHMPLFCFLSGLFVKDAASCRTQLVRIFPMYLLCQALAVLFGSEKVSPLTPYWHLWYLLSNCCWLFLAWVWFRFCKGNGGILLLLFTVAIGCVAGLNPNIGREHSLSRTLVFLPYFWSGVLCDPDISWEKLRPMGIAALGLAFLFLACVGSKISAVFLYQASPYGAAKSGVLLRLACYLLGGALGLFLLAFSPAKRFPFTKAGANTMPAYLLHAPFVLFVRKQPIGWQFYAPLAVVFLYAVYVLTRWHSKLYGIVPTERRVCR